MNVEIKVFKEKGPRSYPVFVWQLLLEKYTEPSGFIRETILSCPKQYATHSQAIYDALNYVLDNNLQINNEFVTVEIRKFYYRYQVDILKMRLLDKEMKQKIGDMIFKKGVPIEAIV
jgi:hypothetical protein